MKPSILFIAASSGGFGGVETWVARCARFLKDHQWPVRLAMLRGGASTDPDDFRQHHPGLVDFEIDGRGLTREGRVRATAALIRKEKPSIVIPLSTFDAIEATCREKRRSRSLHLVGHAQGNLSPQLADSRQYADWWDAIVCPGRLTRNWLVEHGNMSGDLVHHVPNGADPPVATRSRDAGQLRIGYVGRLTQEDKRADDLPRIIQSANNLGLNASWVIVGDGPQASSIRDQVQGQTNVVMHGAMSPEQVYSSIYPNLDVLLLTSESEAFGIVIVEAMRHGVVPVVSRYLGWSSERLVVEDSCGLSFPVGDHEAAAKCLKRLADERLLLERFSNAAKQRGDYFTWQRCLSAWESILEAVADKPSHIGNGIPEIPRRNSGRLDRLPVPVATVECFRAVRRRIAPLASTSNGEGWPFCGRHHDQKQLTEIQSQLAELDRDNVPSDPTAIG